MVLVCTVLQTGIGMRVPGMKEEDKGLVRNGDTQLGHWDNGFSLIQPIKIHFLLDHLSKSLKQSSTLVYQDHMGSCMRVGHKICGNA
ncbi:hypothetical protein L1987_17466 [Smallanthus sonchifolius]|uniref:Uncharacterized protein n=1 Tax=Smallanthus sonchifolius TaxID=185202 RepID=A0ACB9IWV9_9ASTR|nr:hypothetical protein L1987_17466 [Smallanthus sonchifolius]